AQRPASLPASRRCSWRLLRCIVYTFDIFQSIDATLMPGPRGPGSFEGSVMSTRFWSRAAAEPDRIVVVTPDGVEHRAGDVLALANRIVHRLRAGGAQRGDAFATVLPNGLEVLAAYLAAMQAGWYLTPINHHLTDSEIAYLVENSGARCVIAHER